MVTRISAYGLFIFSLVVFISCDDEEKKRETQTGAGTFQMKVDGNLWESPLVTTFPALAVYYPNSKSLLIRAAKKDTDELIILTINDVSKSGEYKINFRTKETSEDSTRLTINGDIKNSYRLLNESGSSLILSKFDTINNIVSGKFSLQMQNKSNSKMTITEGLFDVKIQPFKN